MVRLASPKVSLVWRAFTWSEFPEVKRETKARVNMPNMQMRVMGSETTSGKNTPPIAPALKMTKQAIAATMKSTCCTNDRRLLVFGEGVTTAGGMKTRLFTR